LTAHTPRYGFAYLDPGQSMIDTRDVLAANATGAEAILAAMQAYVDQLATVIPGGQTVIGIDIDGVPYFDPAGSVTNPAGVGIDTDGTPYIVEWTHP
jgi:hypothetical protein